MHYYLQMPRVHSFASCQINIYPKDHMPPHFHVLASDGREWLVRIDNGDVLEGDRNTRAIRAALQWASVPENQDTLLHYFWELHK